MLIWMDGFDHYGGDSALLVDGSYAGIISSSLSNAHVRTGPYALEILGEGFDVGARRVLGADYTTVGLGYAFYLPNLPLDSVSLCLAQFRDDNDFAQCGIWLTSSGQVEGWQGGGPSNGKAAGTILGTSGQVVVDLAFQHFECRVTCDPVAGAIEVRIDGVTVLNLTGINTQGTSCATTNIGQVQIGTPGSADTGLPDGIWIDDLFAWNNTGAFNNDFVGDKKVYTQFPSFDTSQQDWTISTGSSSAAILATQPPNDSADFLEATTAGELTIVGVGGLPSEVVSIAGVEIVSRTFKTDAGTAMAQLGLLNGSANADGANRSITEAPTYYTDIIEADPATGAPWTVAGFNTAELFVERTS
jgi:hypothetical protein